MKKKLIQCVSLATSTLVLLSCSIIQRTENALSGYTSTWQMKENIAFVPDVLISLESASSQPILLTKAQKEDLHDSLRGVVKRNFLKPFYEDDSILYLLPFTIKRETFLEEPIFVSWPVYASGVRRDEILIVRFNNDKTKDRILGYDKQGRLTTTGGGHGNPHWFNSDNPKQKHGF